MLPQNGIPVKAGFCAARGLCVHQRYSCHTLCEVSHFVQHRPAEWLRAGKTLWQYLLPER